MTKLSRTDMMEAVSEGIRRGLWDVATNGNPRVDVPNELLFESIQAGVADAFWRLITNASDAPCADFFAAVQGGTADGISRIKS